MKDSDLSEDIEVPKPLWLLLITIRIQVRGFG